MKYIAGIVLYNPDLLRLEENIDAIRKQADLLLLIDNASDNIVSILKKYDSDPQITIIQNHENLGVAAALNQIMEFGISRKAQWVLTLDQDSVCPKGLIDEFMKFTEYQDVGIISPLIQDRNRAKDRGPKFDTKYNYVKKCITSGSFIRLSILKQTGFFDEKMFIDFVDFDFCFRIRKAGYKILRVNNISLKHQLGDIEPHFIGTIQLKVTNHSALRNYYYGRNGIYGIRKNKDFFLLLNIAERLFNILFFEKNKKEKLYSIFKGMKDGLAM